MIGSYEVESKWTIFRNDFDRLLDRCVILRRIDQLNVYFDNDQWILANAGATCRVRCAPRDRAMFTLKFPVSREADGARRSIEIESPAHAAFTQHFSLYWMFLDFSLLNSELRRALPPMNIPVLRRVGRMRNIRHVLRLPSGGTFELDRFTLPGGEIAFEIEVEECDLKKRAAIVSEVCDLIPDAVPSHLSKFQRFREAVRRHRDDLSHASK